MSYTVHKNLICEHSQFFKTATKQEWLEESQEPIHLPEDDPDVFQVYLHWLYTNTLPTRINTSGWIGNAEYIQLAKAYVLGDKLQDGDFQDVVIDMIVDKCKWQSIDGGKWYPAGEIVQKIYDNTLSNSKARCLLVDIYVSHGSGSWLYDYSKPHDIPKEFIYDLTVSFLDKRKNDPMIKSSLCEYHQHSPGAKNCYRTRLAKRKLLKTEPSSE